jgi:hypothetical protein
VPCSSTEMIWRAPSPPSKKPNQRRRPRVNNGFGISLRLDPVSVLDLHTSNCANFCFLVSSVAGMDAADPSGMKFSLCWDRPAGW